MCSRTSTPSYIIDTCAVIIICTSIRISVIRTYIRVFIRTFVRLSIIDTLHIDFSNSFYPFPLNLHHNFMIKFNTTSSLENFISFFQHNIFLCSFFNPYFNSIFLFLTFKPSSPPLYCTFYDGLLSQVFLLCLVKKNNNKSHWSLPCDQYQS